MRKIWWFILWIIPCETFPLRISEIYYGGDLLISDSERYIEIENTSQEPIDMRKITLVLPRSDTSTISNTLLHGNFLLINEKEAKTNQWILLPGERAVVISEDYNKGGRLLSWNTNTLLFKPRSKTAWTYSWNNRLHLISLLYDGVEIFRDPTIPPMIKEKGKALVWKNGWHEDIPRPGQPKQTKILAPRVLPTESLVEIHIESENYLNELIIEEYPHGNAFRYPLSGFSPYKLILKGSHFHATTWILRTANTSHKIRFLETNFTSPWAKKILISEITSSPAKDYSGGGWTGQDGGGTINEYDDWLEIANLSSESISFSNWFIEHITSQGRGYRKISLRFDNTRGPVSDTFLSPHALGIFSVENGLANKATVIIYDDHPLWGRRVATLSYGTNAIPSPHSTHQEISLQRLPHNAPHDICEWKSLPPTYGTINGNMPYLVKRWSLTNSSLLEIYMSDPEKERGQLFLQARSEQDTKEVILVEENSLFHGTLTVTRVPNPFALQVKNGGKNYLTYTKEGGTYLWEFMWKEEGWQFPTTANDIRDTVIYPNPANTRSHVFISRIPKGTKIIIFEEKGRVIQKYVSEGEDYIVWQTPEKTGLYCILVSYGGRSVHRWVLVK